MRQLKRRIGKWTDRWVEIRLDIDTRTYLRIDEESVRRSRKGWRGGEGEEREKIERL